MTLTIAYTLVALTCVAWAAFLMNVREHHQTLKARTNKPVRVAEILHRAEHHRRELYALLEEPKWTIAHAYHMEQLEAQAAELADLEGYPLGSDAAGEMAQCVYCSVPYDEARRHARRKMGECNAN